MDHIAQIHPLDLSVAIFSCAGEFDANGDGSTAVDLLKTKMPGLIGTKRVKWNFEKS